jgi:outer membrane protein TolC
LTFVALDHDQQREAVIEQQTQYAATLLNIVQERFDAGRDTQVDLTEARLAAAQLRLGLLRAQDDTANDRDHLGHLIGLPSIGIHADGGFPSAPPSTDNSSQGSGPANAGVASAFANASAKMLQARGDARYLYRPQINSVVQYQRYASFTNSFKQLKDLNQTIGSNEAALGVQITIPVFDKFHQAKARETAADAAHALHEAENSQIQVLDNQSRLRHSVAELQLRAEVAGLEQELSQQQLDVLRVQLQAGNPNGPQMSPKDEQNARIAERNKYLTVVDTSFQLHQAEINLLRQQGRLEDWLKSATLTPPPAATNKLKSQ